MIFGAFHRFLVISSIDKIRWTRKVSYKIREFHDLQNVWLLVVNISGQLSRGAWVRQFASTEVHHARVPSLPQHLPTLDIRYTMIHSWLGWFFSWLFLIVFFGWVFCFFFGGRIWVDGDFNSFGMLQQRVSPTVPNSERNGGSLWLCISR